MTQLALLLYLCFPTLFCTALYYKTLHCTTLYCTVRQFCITTLYCTTQYCTVQKFCITLHFTVLQNSIFLLCCTALCWHCMFGQIGGCHNGFIQIGGCHNGFIPKNAATTTDHWGPGSKDWKLTYLWVEFWSLHIVHEN